MERIPRPDIGPIRTVCRTALQSIMDEAVSSFRSAGNIPGAFCVFGLPPSVCKKLFATPPHPAAKDPLSNFEKLSPEEICQIWTQILEKAIYVMGYYGTLKGEELPRADVTIGTEPPRQAPTKLLEAIRLKIESVTSPQFLVRFPYGVQEAMLHPEWSQHRREMPYYWQFSLEYPEFPKGSPDLWTKEQQEDCSIALDNGWLLVIPLPIESEPQQLASPELEQGAIEAFSLDHCHSFPVVSTVGRITTEPQMVEPASPSSTAAGHLEIQDKEFDEVFTYQTTPEQSAAIEDEVDKMLRDSLVSTLKKELQVAKMKANNHDPIQTIENQLRAALQENTNLQDYLRRAYEDYRTNVLRLEEKAVEKAGEAQNVIQAQNQEIRCLKMELSPPAKSVLEAQSLEIIRLQTELTEVNARLGVKSSELEQAKAAMEVQSGEFLRPGTDPALQAQSTARIWELESRVEDFTALCRNQSIQINFLRTSLSETENNVLEAQAYETTRLQSDLKEVNAQSSAKISRLEEANSVQAKKIMETEPVLQAQSNEITRQRTSLDEFKARTAERVCALETQLREARVALKDQTVEIMRLKRELPEPAKCVLEAQSAEIMRLQTELENVRSPTTARICELEAQLREATNRVSGLRFAAQGTSQLTRERLEAQVNETMRLQTELENVENHSSERISELEDRISERDDHILDLRQAAEKLSLELKSELEAVKSQLDARTSKLQAQFEDRQAENGTRISELVSQLQQAADEAREFPAQLLEARQEGEETARQRTSAELPRSQESYDDGFKAGWAFLFDSLEVNSELSDDETKLEKAQGRNERSSSTANVAICPELDGCSNSSPARIRASLSSEPLIIPEPLETVECSPTPTRARTLFPSKPSTRSQPAETLECNPTPTRARTPLPSKPSTRPQLAETLECNPTPTWSQAPLSGEPQASPEPTTPRKRRRLTSPLSSVDPVSSVPDSGDEDTIVVDVGDGPVQGHIRSHLRALAGYDMDLGGERTKKRKRGRPRKVPLGDD